MKKRRCSASRIAIVLLALGAYGGSTAFPEEPPSIGMFPMPPRSSGGSGFSSGDGKQYIQDLRPIQYEYSPVASMVVLEWEIDGGSFDRIEVSVDGWVYFWEGDTTGVRIEGLASGFHEFAVKGVRADGTTDEAGTIFHVFEESPVEPVIPYGTLFYGYNPNLGYGFLQISWETPERSSEDPYLEFEIALDGKFKWAKGAPADSVTFSRIPEGHHTISITAVTFNYASPPTYESFRAVGLAPPVDVYLTMGCSDGAGVGMVLYGIPRGTTYDSVAVWVSGETGREFHGYFQTDPQEIFLEGLPEGTVSVEVVGALFETGADWPYALSNLPGKPGVHAIARGRINCQNRIEFRRGDSDANGRINLSDVIRILFYLFHAAEPLPCPRAADADDNDQLDITDGVRLLQHLFLGGPSIPGPGPELCGEDPTPGSLASSSCTYESCGISAN